LAAKALETVRLTEVLSVSPEDEAARGALAEHLSGLRQSARELGLVHLEAALVEALSRLEQESFGPASLVVVRVLAWRYETLAAMPSQSGMHRVVQEEELPPVKVSLRGRRVLVADAEAEVRWFYVGVLREAGARVIEARDGVHALTLARDDVPDLVLSAMEMPSLDGLGLFAAIRREPALDGIPVVLLSGRGSAQEILDRVSRGLEPIMRLEEWLKSDLEASGDLEELGVSGLLRAVRRLRPNATMVLQDPWSLFDLELHEGCIVAVTRTAIDGAVTQDAAAFPPLVGMSSGRFVVAESSATERGDERPSLDAAFAEATRRLGILLGTSDEGSTMEHSLGSGRELIASELRQDSPRMAEPVERENIRAQSAVAMHREPANPAPASAHPIWRPSVSAGAAGSEGGSGFGMELRTMPGLLGLAFATLLAGTVGFLLWGQLTSGDGPAESPVGELTPAPATDARSPTAEAPSRRTRLSAFSGDLRPRVDPALGVNDGQGVLELSGPSEVSVRVDGVDRGALPVTLVLDQGIHAVRYRTGAKSIDRFYYVKSGATRGPRILTQAGALVDVR
jgi:CheY-like chemotaxis protein